jgi:hypothetical protein
VLIIEGWEGIYSAGGCACVGYFTAIERFGCELSGLFDEIDCRSNNQSAGTVDCIQHLLLLLM